MSKDFFNYLNEVPTTLGPIERDYWENCHKWPYEQIASKIKDPHVIDLGCGCGLLGTYLVFKGYVESADLYDGREPQITYAKDLVKHLGLEDKIKVYNKYAHPNDIQRSTVVTTRFGSLPNFEKFFITNRLITLRRTKEVEPYMIRPMTLPWSIEIVTRSDGFELELLTIDFFEGINKILEEERWMEDLNPTIKEFLKVLEPKEVHSIGQDYVIDLKK